MLKVEHKSKTPRETHSSSKKYNKNNSQKCQHPSESMRQRRTLWHCQDKTATFKREPSPRRKGNQKQNQALNQNTPKLQQNLEKQFNSEDMDQLSLIRFISKECSSIKENQNDVDCGSETNSGNHLDQFSPLFDRLDKGNSDKEDFMLQIEDISENYFKCQQYQNIGKKNTGSFRLQALTQKKQKDINSARNLHQKQDNSNVKVKQKLFRTDSSIGSLQRSSRGGKIKKNKQQTLSKPNYSINSHQKQSWIDDEILYIFQCLNYNNSSLLSPSNCCNQNLSTELNYLIGSIITKIKVKSKQYNLSQFNHEFKQLIEDSELDELKQILARNRFKKVKKMFTQNEEKNQLENKYLNIISEPQKQISFQVSPTFQQNNSNADKDEIPLQKISRISQKLNSYLLKNNLVKNDSTLRHEINKNDRFPRILIYQDDSKRINTPQSDKAQLCEIYQDEDSCFGQRSSLRQMIKSKASRSTISDTLRVEFNLRSQLEMVKGIEGYEFQLNFTELNKHI